jgi:NAD(P)-dependent dehydrogenase (short-subunit alcohol dehydrogenase family)/acyl carrier protein
VREAVRFADGIATLEQAGVTRFLELGPDGVLAMLASRCLSAEAAERALLTQTLRRKRAEAKTLVGFLAAAHAAGLSVEWEVLFAGREACCVDLPTYAFQRERFWLERSVAAVDASAVGQMEADHPLLGAAVELPEGGGWLFTGRLSLRSHPWLADHVVFGTILLPGTAFLELALHAAGRVGLDTVEELVLEAPLILGEGDAVALGVAVAEVDDRGAREVTISSRRHGVGEDAEWTRHASGVLAAGVAEVSEPPAGSWPPEGRRLVGAWPPEGAQALELAGLGVGEGFDFGGVVYGRLAELGFEYGPVFRGLTGVWRRGEEVFAEVALGGGQVGEAGRFGLHPALLDAALHAGLLAAVEAGEQVGLPFVWGGVALHASGAGELRVRITRGAEGLSLVAFDGAGELVVEVGSLGVRAVDPGRLGLAGGGDSLFGVVWVGVSVAGGDDSVTEGVVPGGVATLGALAVPGAGCYPDLAGLLGSLGEGGAPGVVVVEFGGEGSGDLPGGAHVVLKRVLLLLQGWLGEPRLAGARLVVLTHSAVCAVEGDEPDLGLAALWGLLRSARSEHPGRFALVDLDGDEASLGVLPAVLAYDEPELAIRQGVVLAPRLTQVPQPAPVPRPTVAGAGKGKRRGFGLDPQRTVLLTGGTGGLGSLLAGHLVRAYGVRRLLLVSRRGPDAPGAAELGRELEQLGARVRIAACDVAEREQLRALLDSIPPEHSLGAVIHAAGVLDDGVIEGLTPERLDRVLAPKLDAAWYLHELSRAHDLDAFILFSSIASTIGVPGQANYAAANAFLDALAQHRHSQHLPATTLAWGPWATDSGMTGSLSQTDVARWSRAGVGSLSRVQGLELFDTARSVGQALLFAVRLDGVALRLRARGGGLPALLRGLVPAPARRVRGEEVSLAQRLLGMAEEERDAVVLEVVRSAVATVLAYDSAREVEMGRAFKELGFDSLTAVELRNRLSVTTGLRLPSTLVFDHPTPAAVAEVVMRDLSPHDGVEGDRDPEELEVQSVLASIPLERLRASGLFDQLLELAALDGDRAPGVEGTLAGVDQLDAESLIRMSFDRGGSTGDPAGHR